MDFSHESRSGISGSRHLWEFLWTNLDPSNDLAGLLFFDNKEITALCTDLSEATDFANPSVGK